jgi:phage replication O-like protein O
MPDDQQRLDLDIISGPPQYTQVPDVVLDQWLPQLSGSQLKVALAIVRWTRGWRRYSHTITTRRLAAHCNLSQRSVRRATAALADAGVIRILPNTAGTPARQTANTYHLVYRQDEDQE